MNPKKVLSAFVCNAWDERGRKETDKKYKLTICNYIVVPLIQCYCSFAAFHFLFFFWFRAETLHLSFNIGTSIRCWISLLKYLPCWFLFFFASMYTTSFECFCYWLEDWEPFPSRSRIGGWTHWNSPLSCLWIISSFTWFKDEGGKLSLWNL